MCSGVYCQSKKCVLEIISELVVKQFSLFFQVVFEVILICEKMGSIGIGNGIVILYGKLEEDILCVVGVFVQFEMLIVFDVIDNQLVDFFFVLLVFVD